MAKHLYHLKRQKDEMEKNINLRGYHFIFIEI